MKAVYPIAVTIRYQRLDLPLWPLSDTETLIVALFVALPALGFVVGYLAGRA